MKRIYLLLIPLLFAVSSCKKDAVDATDTKTFQSSINDMATSLTTLQQVKFNEALYILKTFGVEGDNDVQKLAALGKKINGMKVPQILAMADQVAQENGIAWTSTGPPSLGEMNIFGNETATEFDPNDIKASSLDLATIQTMKDSVLGAKAIQVIPRLVDASGKPVEFSGAALETIMEVFSGGVRISTSKNLMPDNDFKGFTIKMASLPTAKIVNNEIDVTVTVKTTNKNFKMSKVGVSVNPKALLTPQIIEKNIEESSNTNEENPSGNTEQNPSTATTPSATNVGDPKTTVTRFLNNLGNQNLRNAFDATDHSGLGPYESFSNPTSGFGAVKNIQVKNISTANSSGNSAQVNATYDVTDNTGKTTALKVTFGLKQVNGEWKISNYKIN
ncbi:MAG: hypothetical protein Q4G16_04110 [Cruoricaptor ignavus]|nr:hypothetical protein [Cruoricaptor ignavus]